MAIGWSIGHFFVGHAVAMAVVGLAIGAIVAMLVVRTRA
jgi:hypothetical protein